MDATADLPALFTYGFRPFLLGEGLTAARAVPLWLLMLVTGAAPAGPLEALNWHAHEMIFGYIAAVVTGYGSCSRKGCWPAQS